MKDILKEHLLIQHLRVMLNFPLASAELGRSH